MATTQPVWCEACGACFRCGEAGVYSSLVAHRCPDSTGAVHDVGHLILASGPIRPGYQHSTATHVEGREAPKREGGHGFTPTPGVVPCESFRDARAGGPGALYFCDVHIEDPACWHCGAARSKHGPDIEACARAAYEASWRHDPAVLPWDLLGDDLQDRAREVARAVLSAAGRGGK